MEHFLAVTMHLPVKVLCANATLTLPQNSQLLAQLGIKSFRKNSVSIVKKCALRGNSLLFSALQAIMILEVDLLSEITQN